MKNSTLALILSGILIQVSLPASAYDYKIDEFTVTKSNPDTGVSAFSNTFVDGLVPPNPNYFGPGQPDFFVLGTMGPESSGQLTLNSADGAVTHDPNGNAYTAQIAILNTNVDPTNLDSGLKSVDTFSVTGIFDLVVPAEIQSGYGIRLTDRVTAGPTLNTGVDQIQIFVWRASDGSAKISLNAQNYVTGGNVILASDSLLSGYNQIALRLDRADAGSNNVVASYAYGDGGVFGAFNSLANEATIFNDVSFTRAGFIAFAITPVPEPDTYAMLLAGLGLLGFVAKRRKQRASA